MFLSSLSLIHINLPMGTFRRGTLCTKKNRPINLATNLYYILIDENIQITKVSIKLKAY